MKRARLLLVAVGVFVWVPYLVLKYYWGIDFPVGYVLAVHIPCMVAALVLRIMESRRRRRASTTDFHGKQSTLQSESQRQR